MTSPRVAIVTGAAQGIGAGVAVRLAEDGLAVAVLDLDETACADTVSTITKAGGSAVAIGCDVSDRAQVAAAVQRTVDELGAPTVVVNNAGVTRDALLFKMTDDEWGRVIDVHLTGTFLVTQAVQKHMVDAGFGRVVNLSSTAALGNRGQANYAAAKAGIQGFTKAMAKELGQFGITVNSVAPGFIVTDMTRAVAERLGIEFEAMRAKGAKAIPVRRTGEPEDIAQVVSFFADERSGFVSGQVVYAAGGPVD